MTGVHVDPRYQVSEPRQPTSEECQTIAKGRVKITGVQRFLQMAESQSCYGKNCRYTDEYETDLCGVLDSMDIDPDPEHRKNLRFELPIVPPAVAGHTRISYALLVGSD
jgi:hypothetical protein